MDAGTAYTAQTYNLTGQFLPKEWIMEKWEEGFYITAMAGSNSGWSLVAMSKGTPYTQQSYKVRLWLILCCELLPEDHCNDNTVGRAELLQSLSVTRQVEMEQQRRISSHTHSDGTGSPALVAVL